MKYPELNRGDRGEDVEQLQTLLNKAGAMLVTDGDFGPATERGVRYAQDLAGVANTGTVDDELWTWAGEQPDPFPDLATDGVAFIAREETGGLAYYDQVARAPHYPGHSSGITIGVGYDLRFHTEEDFRELWNDHLPAEHIDELAKDIDKAGTKKRAAELQALGIEVSFGAAWPVFIEAILPRHYEKTLAIYPSLENLPLLCRAVLVSLVYNRGTSFDGPTRREMREIRDILVRADDNALHKRKRIMILSDVEEQILSMKRLWSPSSGLIKRRQSEANLWRDSLAHWCG